MVGTANVLKAAHELGHSGPAPSGARWRRSAGGPRAEPAGRDRSAARSSWQAAGICGSGVRGPSVRGGRRRRGDLLLRALGDSVSSAARDLRRLNASLPRSAGEDSPGSVSTASTGAANGSVWFSPQSWIALSIGAVGASSVSWNPSGCARRSSATSRCRPVESMKDRPRRSSTRRARFSMPSSAAPGLSDGRVERAAQRFSGGEVELAAGLHDRDMFAPLDLDGEGLDRTSRPLELIGDARGRLTGDSCPRRLVAQDPPTPRSGGQKAHNDRITFGGVADEVFLIRYVSACGVIDDRLTSRP